MLREPMDGTERRPAEPDTILMQAACADPQAFGILYDRYVDTIYRYLYRQIGTREVAEDLTSLTFMRALGALNRFSLDRPVAPWLVRIAHNALVDYRRRAGRTVPLDDEIAHTLEGRSEPGAAGDLEQAEVFDALTAGLPADQRDALALRFVADLSMQQTADTLGRSLGATKMLVTRGLATVRARPVERGGGRPMRWKYLARTNTVRREDRLGVAAEDLSPELRAAGERLRAASRPVPRDPAFTARLRAELLLAHRGRALPPPRHLRLPRRSRRLVLLAALMASFGGGIAAARVLAPAPAPGTVLPGVTPLVRTVFVGQTVGALAVDGRTGRAFVVARSAPIRGSVPQMVVRMLDTTTGALLRTVVLGTAGGIGTSVMAVDQRTGRVFVAHEERMGGESSAVVSVLDARSGAVLRQTHLSSRMTVGMPPGPALSQPELAIDERIGRAFLTSNETDTVSVFDAASGALRGAIGVGRAPHALAIDARRGRVVVANGSAMTVSILDAVTGHVLRTADVGGCPNAVAIDERTGHAFVTLGYAANRRRATTQDAGRVAVLAIQTGQVLATVAVLGTPHAVTVAGAARHVFVGGATFSGAGRVSMLDAATGRVLRTSVVGAYPTALVSAVGGERVVVTTVVRPGAVTALSDSVVSVLDAHSGRVVCVVRASLGLLSPGAVAVDDRTGQVFIANEDTVSVLTVGR